MKSDAMVLNLPLISPLSRKYYGYAAEDNARIHHRAIDIRLCLENICDEIVFKFVTPETRAKWGGYNLHNKIKSAKEFMDNVLVDKVLTAKGIGNRGAHEGEEGDYTAQDIAESLEVIKQFSLEIFYSYFIKNGFGDTRNGSWVPAVFSTLPPIYRVTILSKYYMKEPSSFVIDKLSKAYVKSGMKKEGIDFLENCFKNKEITHYELLILKYDLDLLEESLSHLPIANTLEKAKENFNRLLPAINEDERDVFVYLVSMILNGDS